MRWLRPILYGVGAVVAGVVASLIGGNSCDDSVLTLGWGLTLLSAALVGFSLANALRGRSTAIVVTLTTLGILAAAFIELVVYAFLTVDRC